jgi:DNA polymerase-3 subunit alpha
MIPEALMADDSEKAISLAKQFSEMFDGEFYLELQHHPSLDKQMKVNAGLKELAKATSIPLIATSDIHYVKQEDKDTHEVLLAINTGKDLASDDRMSLADVDLFMHDEAFFKENFADVPEIIENTAKIAEKCNLDLKLGESILPIFEVPEGYTADTYLEKLCQDGLKERYEKVTPELQERLRYELDTINKMGFPAYFLIVADIVTWAKSQGIFCGPRGSAAGSLVAYLTKISDMDPIEYGYLFERFLNPDRISMPDIDIDFADDRRDEVIAYASQKYGADHVAGIATFGTMMGRAAVRDVGRVLGMTYGEVDEIAKLVPPPNQGRHIPLRTSIENVPELKERYQANPQMKRLLDFAVKLEGTVRHASQHACAFVICREPTITYTPVQPAQRGREGLVTQYSMKPIEEIGILKMDFLGLANWSIMKNTVRIIRRVYGIDIDVMKLPLDDKKTYDLLTAGNTTGVFQLESDGMKRYIKDLKPTNIYDIMAMVSLYRPGPMQNIPTYIARKHGKEEVQYLHPKMANSLGETFGIPIYQEQVMQGSKDLAGFTGGQADTLRKAMGKKIQALMAEMKSKFIEGCKTHSDIEAPLAEQIWKQYEDFASYGFNKSHAGCYALIAFQTAYLKAHYPAAFFAALLTSNADNLDKMAIEMAEAAKMGIEVLPPDVNESFPEFGVRKVEERECIRFGLAAIKNVGFGVAEKIVEERSSGPYTSLTDFLMRLGPTVLNKRVLEALSMTGALDSFGERNALVQSVEVMTRFIANKKKDASQIGLFSLEQTALVSEIALMDAPALERRVALEWEKTLLGIYLTGHPLKEIESILPHIATPVSKISLEMNGQNQRVGGMISELRVINTKNNEAMAFVKLQDFTGTIELVVFPRTWSEVKVFAQTDRYIVADGRVDTRDGAPKLIVSRLLELHPQEGVAQIKAALGPVPKSNGFYKKKDDAPKAAEPVQAAPARDKNSLQVAAQQEKAPANARVVLKIPQNAGRKTLEDIRFLLESHAGSVPVFIEAVRGGNVIQAKTKSLVKPSKDLVLLLQQRKVGVTIDGMSLDDNPLAPEPADEDIAIHTYVEEPDLVTA